MSIKKSLLISFLFALFSVQSQTVKHIYKIDGLLKRVGSPDTTYILNFWAVWCKPCIQELPSFDSLQSQLKNKPVKILLVNLDFKEDAQTKVNVFLKKNKISCECVMLDEINGNDYIDRISKQWTGSIPATLIKKGKRSVLIEKKATTRMLHSGIAEVSKK